jgi:hypothetical protein
MAFNKSSTWSSRINLDRFTACGLIILLLLLLLLLLLPLPLSLLLLIV